MPRASCWIVCLLLLLQALALLRAQRLIDLHDTHLHFPRPDLHATRLHVQRPGVPSFRFPGIRPSRAGVPRCVNPRLFFRNGLTKLRYRGRVVKYVCRPGYTLFGDSVSTCNAGRWDRPVPVCAAPGCRIPTAGLLARGTVENYRGRGLMLKYSCRLGYMLRGGAATSFCDGRSWNGSRPTCDPVVLDPEPSCDFETLDQCGWTSDLSSTIQFSRLHDSQEEEDAGADNSTAGLDAGPVSSPSGHYMALESLGHRLALPGFANVARLVSPPYRPLRFRACFRFWYRLQCHLCTLRLLMWGSYNVTVLWSSYGPRKAGWASVDVPHTSEDFQLVFEARTQRPGEVGVAIDDVRLGPECQDVPTAEPPPATTTLLPDDVTTELDTGDTWDTTPADVAASASKDDGTDNSSNETTHFPGATVLIPVTSVSERLSSENNPDSTTPYFEPTTRIPSPHVTSYPTEKEATSPAQTALPFTVPTTLLHPRATSGFSSTVARTRAPVTSHVTYRAFTTGLPDSFSDVPPTRQYFDTKTPYTRWKPVNVTTQLPTSTRQPVTDTPRYSTMTTYHYPLNLTTYHVRYVVTKSPPPVTTRPGTRYTMTPSIAAVTSEKPVTTNSWVRTMTTSGMLSTSSGLVTRPGGNDPSVDGNTVGPGFTPQKPAGGKTRSWTTNSLPVVKTSAPVTAFRVHSTVSSLPVFHTTHTLNVTAVSSASTRYPSSTKPTESQPTTGSTTTQTTPLTKPTKPRKKATEMATKPFKWTTMKPIFKTKVPVTSPPQMSSSLAASSEPVSKIPDSGKPSPRLPKTILTDKTNVVKPAEKPSGSWSTSKPHAKNDEDNEIMLNDEASLPVVQQKPSAAAAVASSSSWSVPAILIAAGALVVGLLVTTVLLRWRRRYQRRAEDSEMEPLSKFSEMDAAELASS